MKIRSVTNEPPPPTTPKKTNKAKSRWIEVCDAERIVALIQTRGRSVAIRASEPEWSRLVQAIGWPVKSENRQATVVVPLPLLGTALTVIGHGALELFRKERPGWRVFVETERAVSSKRAGKQAILAHTSRAKTPAELTPEQGDLFDNAAIQLPEVKGDHPFHRLRPYQQAGVALLLESGLRFVLGDDMGLGKTGQSLVSIELSDANRVLVVCPKVVARNWQIEASTWAPSLDVTVAGSAAKIRRWIERESPPDDRRKTLVVTWGLLEGSLEELASVPWTSVLADEEHQAKEISAGRTRALLAISYGARHRIGITGTPILNRPVELFPLLHFVDPIVFDRFLPFAERYGAPRDVRTDQGQVVRQYRGASHVDELARILRPWMIRRMKEDVLQDLPPRIEKVVHVDADRELLDRCDAVLEALKKNQSDGTALGKLVGLRQEVGLAKVPAAAEILEELVAAGEAVVVFLSHHPVRLALEAHLDKLGIRHDKIVGETSQKRRQDVKEAFQRGEIPVLIGSEAMRDGVTLTHSKTTLHVERWYTPAGEDQGMSRVHRFGQTRETLHIFLHLDGSLDEWMTDLLYVKDERIARILERDGSLK